MQDIGYRLTALEREVAQLKTGLLVTADAAAALPIPPSVEKVVVNPGPPATAVPFVKAEKKFTSNKYVKLKDMRVALTESQQTGVGALRNFYTDGPGSTVFIVKAFRETGYTALSVDIAKRYLHS